MVDFRYHLISLIAVILALALGILAGSGFLGGPLLERLRTEVSDLADTNGELRREIDEQDDQLAAAETFARAIGAVSDGRAIVRGGSRRRSVRGE